jgi:hypothetical protein
MCSPKISFAGAIFADGIGALTITDVELEG